MEFNTQICTTREQSERLLALGLKKETADCRWVGLVKDAKGNDIPIKKQVWFTQTREDEHAMVCGFMRYDFIPAWSLHRLLSIAGDTLDLPIIMFDIGKRMRDIGHFYCYEEIIQFIDDAIKEGYLNKEYLEE